MDIITKIKYMYEIKGLSMTEIGKLMGHSRTTISKYLNGGDPGYHRKTNSGRPITDKIRTIIENWIAEDENTPRKQRRTRQKMFADLVQHYEYEGSYTTVKRVVKAITGIRREVYVPRHHNKAEFAEYDLGDLYIKVAGKLVGVKLHGFQLTCSNDIFARLSLRAIQEEIFESHKQAFEHFDGVPLNIRYDNLKQVVYKVLRGRKRLETISFQTFKSQFGFEAQYCAVARGQEKGDVEGCIGYIRRNFFSPIPELNSLDELDSLNQRLADWCRSLRQTRIVYGTHKTVGQAYLEEKCLLLYLPRMIREVGKLTTAKANHYSLISVDSVFYSVPVTYAHQELDVLVGARHITIRNKDLQIARHNRSWEKGKHVFDPLHYLPLFKKKPYALLNSKPIIELPQPFLLFFKKAYLKGYAGVQDCLKILELLKKYRVADIADALELAMAYDTYYLEGVKNLLIQLTSHQPVFQRLTTFKRSDLAEAQVKQANLVQYNTLLSNHENLGAKNDKQY